MAIHHGPSRGRIGNHLAVVGAEIETLELCEQVIVVERKIGNGFGELVVGHDGNFISRPEARGDGSEALLNLRLLPLIEVVVQKNDRRKRHRLGGELPNFLFDAVREDPEVVLLKISYQLAAAIFYGYGNDDGVCWNNNARWILPLPGDGLSRSAGAAGRCACARA